MKLYDFKPAPNPRRVRIYLAEKGIEVPTVQIALREGEQFCCHISVGIRCCPSHNRCARRKTFGRRIVVHGYIEDIGGRSVAYDDCA